MAYPTLEEDARAVREWVRAFRAQQHPLVTDGFLIAIDRLARQVVGPL